MTVSNNNLSNFEAKFIRYIQYSSISRIVKKRLRNDFKDYISLLKLSNPAKIYGNYRKLFSARTINTSKQLFMAKYKNAKRWDQFIGKFNSFKMHLILSENNYQTVSNYTITYQDLLDKFITYLETEKFSSSTVRNYKADLKQLLQYLNENNINLEDISDADLLKSYSDYLDNRLLLDSDSVKRKFSAISSFIKWAKKKTDFFQDTEANITEIKPKFNILKNNADHHNMNIIQDVQSDHTPSSRSYKFNFQVLFYSLILIVLSISLSI